MVNMTYAGRIYQNPHDEKEVWINVGWYGYDYEVENAQIYPDYDDRLAQYVSNETYNDLVQFLKHNMQNKPCIDKGCAAIICCCTCGICFCPKLYVKEEYRYCKAIMTHAFFKQNICKEWEVSLRFVKETEPVRSTSSPWTDSTGQTLILLNEDNLSNKISGPGGPPPGVNMVLNLPDVIPWPSPSTPIPPPADATAPLLPPPDNIPPYLQQPPNIPPHILPPVNVPQYPPQPADVSPYPPPLTCVSPYPPPLLDAPPPYPAQPQDIVSQQPTGHNYCGECGSSVIGNKFCTNCGARN